MARILKQYPTPWRVKRHDDIDGTISYGVYAKGVKDPIVWLQENDFEADPEDPEDDRGPGSASGLAYLIANSVTHANPPAKAKKKVTKKRR